MPSLISRLPQRGGRRLYGTKTPLWDWFRYREQLVKAPSPVYGESGITLCYVSHDLSWCPLGQLVRFLWVSHPTRGNLILLCTDLTLAPLEIAAHYPGDGASGAPANWELGYGPCFGSAGVPRGIG
jgi:hypothetical protein